MSGKSTQTQPDPRFHFVVLHYDQYGRDYRVNFPFSIMFVLAKIATVQ